MKSAPACIERGNLFRVLASHAIIQLVPFISISNPVSVFLPERCEVRACAAPSLLQARQEDFVEQVQRELAGRTPATVQVRAEQAMQRAHRLQKSCHSFADPSLCKPCQDMHRVHQFI